MSRFDSDRQEINLMHTPESRLRALDKIRLRREAWFNKNGPCKLCGTWNELQLDHVDPATKIDHKVWSWSKERREVELAKCQALCRECHEKKTLTELTNRPHGTAARYKKERCRCDVCVSADTARKAAWRARTGKH